ncbi:MAG: hypothetical protein F4186_05485 [Boseongicola sp. SB0676_bin_33]|uniref:Uncharacterized protein n=1 Tax=Boseongicola sp. SB0664_bin_43 TaxID=2604844 RepID=A0A6B0XZ20_9RHOB|nr:hypothetical protein [Boseongicola sp. SB0664_bin_43]MYF88840.1 hypothetical protein [Boseongicola sp. SB0676_bin_33]MYK32292.1 hypothetical protein [Boseongicola sp. SB0670_bin_30]
MTNKHNSRALDGDGFSVVHTVPIYCTPERAALLVQYGFDVDILARVNDTPPQTNAAWAERPEMARAFVMLDADVTLGSGADHTPLMAAAWIGEISLIDHYLVEELRDVGSLL